MHTDNTFYMVIQATKHFKRCTHEKTTLSIWWSDVQPSLPGTLETSAAPEVWNKECGKPWWWLLWDIRTDTVQTGHTEPKQGQQQPGQQRISDTSFFFFSPSALASPFLRFVFPLRGLFSFFSVCCAFSSFWGRVLPLHCSGQRAEVTVRPRGLEWRYI